MRDLRRARAALGSAEKVQHPSEAAPLVKMGKKLVAARDLLAGHVLTPDDIDFKSPGDGLAPYEIGRVVGKALAAPLRTDDAVVLEVLEPADG